MKCPAIRRANLLPRRSHCGSHVPPGGPPDRVGVTADRLRGRHCVRVARRTPRAAGAHYVSTQGEKGWENNY